MADTTVPLTTLTPGAAAVAEPEGTAITAANTHTITLPRGVCPDEVVVRVVNTTAAEKVVTVTAGDAPPSIAGEPKKIDVTLAEGDTTPTVAYVQLSSAQMQDDGTVVITVAANTTGFLTAFRVSP